MRGPIGGAVALALGLAAGPMAAGQETEGPDLGEAGPALRRLAREFEAAYARGDAPAIAALFTADGELIGADGERTAGREAIAGRFARVFEADPGATLSIEPRTARRLTPEVVVEEGVATIRPADPGAEPQATPYTAILVNRDGRWLQASVRDHPAPPESTEPNLGELAWLEGEWVGESPGGVVECRGKWDEGGHFLLIEYTASSRGEATLRGTVRLGWDPAARRVRSWEFDSAGGFGEGTWTPQGPGRWRVESEGVGPDGTTTAAARLVTRLDPHRAAWRRVDPVGPAEGSGPALLDEVVLTRKPPEPGGEPANPGGTER